MAKLNWEDAGEFDMSFIEWLEDNANKNLFGKLDNIIRLEDKAYKMLMILISGAGFSGGYLVKMTADNSGGWLFWGLFMFCLYFLWIAFLLMKNALSVGKLPSRGSSPDLFDMGFSFKQIRVSNINNINGRIDMAMKRGKRMSLWINRVGYLISFSPICFFSSYIGSLLFIKVI